MLRGLKITKPQFQVVICYRNSATALLILYYIRVIRNILLKYIKNALFFQNQHETQLQHIHIIIFYFFSNYLLLMGLTNNKTIYDNIITVS